MRELTLSDMAGKEFYFPLSGQGPPFYKVEVSRAPGDILPLNNIRHSNSYLRGPTRLLEVNRPAQLDARRNTTILRITAQAGAEV